MSIAWKRPGAGAMAGSAAAIRSSDTPIECAVATAPSTFATLKRPGRRVVSSSSPSGVVTTKRAPATLKLGSRAP
jgi:hypothetical protein